MPKLTFMPNHSDEDVTESGGVKFYAYQPVDVSDEGLFKKLKRNPFFTEGEPDPERKAKWETVRRAQKRAAELRAEADALERDPELIGTAKVTAEKTKETFVSAEIGSATNTVPADGPSVKVPGESVH